MVQFIASFILIFLMSGAGYLSAAQRAVSLIITGGVIVTMDDDRRVLTPGAIAIAGDGIVAIGSPDRVQKDYISDDTIEASGQIVLPGLINTHTHAPMVMYR
ncbi:MAG TPA: amidohydrolase, partial [Acidobacteria bacterium]|nr:amidohydrolase [Acidobacteriota bacterium]